MYKTKIGIARYLVKVDIAQGYANTHDKDKYKYFNEKAIKKDFKNDIEQRAKILVSDIDALAQYVNTHKGVYDRYLLTLKTLLKNVFIGFAIQDNINKLWRIKTL